MVDTVFIADSWTYRVDWTVILFSIIAICIAVVRVRYWKTVAKHPEVEDETKC